MQHQPAKTRLGPLLVAQGLLHPRRLDEAYQRQLIYGGSLDTILLEMNAVEEKRLWPALAETLGLELPPSEVLESLEWRLKGGHPADGFRASFDWVEGFRHACLKNRVAPLSLSTSSLRVLLCESSPPGTREALAKIAAELQVEAWAAPEYRVYFELDRRCDVSMSPRYAGLAARYLGPAVREFRRSAITAAQTQPLAASAPVPIRQPASRLRDLPGWRGLSAPSEEEILGALCELGCARLDGVAAYVFERQSHGEKRPACAVLATASWFCRPMAVSPRSVEVQRIEAFRHALDTATPYLGPWQEDARRRVSPFQGNALTSIVLPIQVGDKVGALLYGENSDGVVRQQDLAEIVDACEEAGRNLAASVPLAKEGPDESRSRAVAGVLHVEARKGTDPDAIAERLTLEREKTEPLLRALESMGDAGMDATIRTLMHLWAQPDVREASPSPGRLFRALGRFGARAIAPLSRLLVHSDPNLRRLAIQALAALEPAEVMPLLGSLLPDRDATVRADAAAMIRRLAPSRRETYRELTATLKQKLDEPSLDASCNAALALGELRETEAVPWLIDPLRHPERVFARACRRALVEITKQDFGRNRRRWHSWWDRNCMRPREEWLLEGLGHRKAAIRLSAYEELRHTTDAYYGYHFDLPKRDREAARKRWGAAWKQTGQTRPTTSPEPEPEPHP